MKKSNEPPVFCVVYCFLSRFARARVSLNKRRALMAVSRRPAARTCGGVSRRFGVSVGEISAGRTLKPVAQAQFLQPMNAAQDTPIFIKSPTYVYIAQ